MRVLTSGYYWAYRKGSPVPDIVYVHDGKAYEICLEDWDGEPIVCTWEEDLSEQKWILGEKISPPGVDNLP